MAIQSQAATQAGRQPGLATLADLRRKLDNGYLYLLESQRNEPAYKRGRLRYIDLMGEYSEGVRGYGLANSQAEMRAAQTALLARLERGWEYTGEWTEDVCRHFDTLVRQYEALTDARRNFQSVTEHLAARIRLLDAVRAGGANRL